MPGGYAQTSTVHNFWQYLQEMGGIAYDPWQTALASGLVPTAFSRSHQTSSLWGEPMCRSLSLG